LLFFNRGHAGDSSSSIFLDESTASKSFTAVFDELVGTPDLALEVPASFSLAFIV